MKLAVVDYGIGNISSVVNSLIKLGRNPQLIHEGKALQKLKPDYIILPGVGAVGEALKLIRNKGIEEALIDAVINDRIPFLGICVGMQILVEDCEEFGSHKGLSWIPGKTRKLINDDKCKYKVPHIGWNNIDLLDKNDRIFNLLDGGDFYFVHSNIVICPEKYVLATTTYERPFASVIKYKNIYGVQFHPEKSSNLGEKVFRGFLNI